MRIFDVIGVVAVTTWLVIAGMVGYREWTREEIALTPDDIQLAEGDTWMVLTREGEEVGFVHETRTVITEGWLLEYELLFQIEIAGQRKLLKTRTRATLDQKAYLKQFNADIESFIGAFEVRGQVEGNTLTLISNLGGKDQERTIALPEPPRLSNNAVNQLVANPDMLVPGRTITQEMFDPMSSGMNKMVYTYIERRELDIYGTKHNAFLFRQQLMGEELDVFVSPEGEILIQEFPMRTAGAKIPNALGKSRAAVLRERLEKESRESAKNGDDPLAEMQKLLGQDPDAKKEAPGGSVQETLLKLGNALTPGKKEAAPKDTKPENKTPPADPPTGEDMAAPGADMDAAGATPDMSEAGAHAPDMQQGEKR